MSVQSGTMAAGSTATYTGTMKGPKNIKRKKLSAPIKEEPPAAENKESAPEDKESAPEDKESTPEPPVAPGALAPPPPSNPFGTPSVSPVPTRRTQVNATLKLTCHGSQPGYSGGCRLAAGKDRVQPGPRGDTVSHCGPATSKHCNLLPSLSPPGQEQYYGADEPAAVI